MKLSHFKSVSSLFCNYDESKFSLYCFQARINQSLLVRLKPESSLCPEPDYSIEGPYVLIHAGNFFITTSCVRQDAFTLLPSILSRR
jgi:hypothetical protein